MKPLLSLPTFSVLLAILLLLMAIPSSGQPGDLSWKGAWQYGTSGAVAVDTVRSYGYLASGGAILTLDISDPNNPVQIDSSIRTSGQVLDIHVDYNDQNLLLACDEAGLQIWDVDNATAPSMISSIEILYGGVETPVRHVDQYMDFAVTENEWGYVHTVDISDPANPFQVAFNGVMGNPAHDISVSSDGYIHATGQQYFVLLEILPDGSLNLAANYYYVAGSVYGTAEASYLSLNNQLFIISRTGGGTGYAPATFHDIVVKNDTAYMIGDSTFMIYDVSDPSNPSFVSDVTVSDYSTQLDVMGHYAYISCGHEGMKTVDFSDPLNPAEISDFEGTGVTWANRVDGNYSYLANSSSGVSVIDISDPSGDGPVKISGIPSDAETRDLDIEGGVLYFADWTGGVRVYDVADPANPAQLGSILNINAWRVDANGDELFVIHSNPNNPDELQIYDVSSPGSPSMISQMDLPDLNWEVVWYDDHLYIPASDSGLVIIDVTNPANPGRIATVDLPDVSDVDILNDTAYVASTDWDGGLVTIDINDPANPQILNIYNPSGWYHPSHVAVSGDYAYTSENFGQLKMFDVSDPVNPQEIDEYTTSGSVVQMTATNNYLYVSDGPDGLQIMYNNLGSVTASFTADQQDICVGSTVNFTDLSTGGVTSWEWTFDGGTPGTSSQQNPSITYNSAGTFDVELIVSDGTLYDTLTEEDYITVSVLPGQPATPSGPTETCQGGEYEYTVMSVGGATTYEWMLDPDDAGILAGSDTLATFVADSLWTGAYTIEVRASNSCGDGPWSPALSANLNYTPEQYTLLGGGTYCEGTGGLELVLDGSETGVDYELFVDNVSTGIIEPGTGDTLSFGYHTEEGYYTVTGYTDNCSEEMEGENYIEMMTVPGQAGMPSGSQMVCNDQVTIYTSTGAAEAVSYTWTLSPDQAGTMTPDSLTVEIDWSQTYSGTAMLSLYGSNQCGDGPVSDELVISVSMAPSPEVMGPDTACADEPATYLTEENPGSLYEWEVTGGTIQGSDTTSQVEVLWGSPGAGTVAVTEETGEGCIVTSEALDVNIEECLGIGEEPDDLINVHPNPVTNILRFSIDNDISSELKVTIYNVFGQAVAEQLVEAKEGATRYQVNVSDFRPGLYILEVADDKQFTVTTRFIKN